MRKLIDISMILSALMLGCTVMYLAGTGYVKSNTPVIVLFASLAIFTISCQVSNAELDREKNRM